MPAFRDADRQTVYERPSLGLQQNVLYSSLRLQSYVLQCPANCIFTHFSPVRFTLVCALISDKWIELPV